MDLHIDDEFERIFLKLSEKPLSRQCLIAEKCFEIEQVWDARKNRLPPTRARRDMYDKMASEGMNGAYADGETGLMMECLFFGAGPERPALYGDGILTAFVGERVLRRANDRALVRAWCRGVYQVWPDDLAVLQPLIDSIRRLASKNEQAAGLADKGLIDVEAPKRMADAVPEDEAIDEFTALQSDNLAARFSGFSHAAWRESFGRYAKLVETAEDDVDLLAGRLKRIERESVLPTRRFRDLRQADAFAKAVLKPYDKGSGKLPTLPVQEQLWQFFERIFGETNDPESALVWRLISEWIKALVEHWKQGRALIDAFDLVETIARKYAPRQATTPKLHWAKRCEFWRQIWNNGHITACKVFVRDAIMRSQEVLKYQETGVPIGIVRKDPYLMKGQAVIAMTVRDAVLAVEVNFNGALRIVDLHSHPSMNYHQNSRLPPDWRYDLDRVGANIRHDTGWENRASYAINKIVGFRIV